MNQLFKIKGKVKKYTQMLKIPENNHKSASDACEQVVFAVLVAWPFHVLVPEDAAMPVVAASPDTPDIDIQVTKI